MRHIVVMTSELAYQEKSSAHRVWNHTQHDMISYMGCALDTILTGIWIPYSITSYKLKTEKSKFILNFVDTTDVIDCGDPLSPSLETITVAIGSDPIPWSWSADLIPPTSITIGS